MTASPSWVGQQNFHPTPAHPTNTTGPGKATPHPAPPATFQRYFPCASSAITSATLSRIWIQPSTWPLFFALSIGSLPM